MGVIFKIRKLTHQQNPWVRSDQSERIIDKSAYCIEETNDDALNDYLKKKNQQIFGTNDSIENGSAEFVNCMMLKYDFSVFRFSQFQKAVNFFGSEKNLLPIQNCNIYIRN